MLITHEIDIDLVKRESSPRIQVKQGDVMSRNIQIHLYANGKPWNVPSDASVVIRYCAWDTEGAKCTHGMYDTMEDGSPAWLIFGNDLEIMPLGEMMAHPGLVTVDVLLASGAKKLATFDFSICVNPGPMC